MIDEDDHRLKELRLQSASALDWIAKLPESYIGTPEVCWSIGWRQDLYQIPVSDEVVLKVAAEANKELAASGIPFLEPPLDLFSLGGEMFERSSPTAAWLDERLAVLPELLKRHGLWIQGWAYEPRDCKPFQWDPLESTCRHASLSIL